MNTCTGSVCPPSHLGVAKNKDKACPGLSLALEPRPAPWCPACFHRHLQVLSTQEHFPGLVSRQAPGRLSCGPSRGTFRSVRRLPPGWAACPSCCLHPVLVVGAVSWHFRLGLGQLDSDVVAGGQGACSDPSCRPRGTSPTTLLCPLTSARPQTCVMLPRQDLRSAAGPLCHHHRSLGPFLWMLETAAVSQTGVS